jgi:ArsR family transcriptional regulator
VHEHIVRSEIMKPTIVIQSIDQDAGAFCCSPVPGEIGISETDAIELANALKALADPTRLQILNLLAGSDEPTCVCNITPLFSISQPTISHHLRILRDANFIYAERRGTFMYYQLNRAALAGLPDAMRQLIEQPVAS